jgi:hypothetical protein
MQSHIVYLYLKTALHVSGGISTHHQERIQLYLQHLVFVTPLLLYAVDTVVCASDDGRKHHPKHVEQFPDINKLCNVASCWIYSYIGILLRARPILHISRIRVKHPSNTSCDVHKFTHSLLSSHNRRSYLPPAVLGHSEICCIQF